MLRTFLERLQAVGIVPRFLPSWGRQYVGKCSRCGEHMESRAGYDARMRPICGWCIVEMQNDFEDGFSGKYVPERRGWTRWNAQAQGPWVQGWPSFGGGVTGESRGESTFGADDK